MRLKLSPIVYVAIIFLVLVSTLVYFLTSTRSPNKISASTQTSQVTSQAHWQAGTLDNVVASGGGSISIDDTGLSSIDLLALYNADNSRVTATINQASAQNILDSNDGTTWAMGIGGPSLQWWQMDLGSDYYTSRATAVASQILADLSLSTNGSDWTVVCQLGPIGSCDFAGTSFRYVKFRFPQSPVVNESVASFSLSGGATATHTTGATQIDGGEDFWEWEAITPAQTTPANTSIAYRYRTSTDGATWTAWVADIGSVTSRSGDDKYRYLQVEATLANTDGASTPTIDSYDIQYHTEVKPSQPSAQTAVVQ